MWNIFPLKMQMTHFQLTTEWTSNLLLKIPFLSGIYLAAEMIVISNQ